MQQVHHPLPHRALGQENTARTGCEKLLLLCPYKNRYRHRTAGYRLQGQTVFPYTAGDE